MRIEGLFLRHSYLCRGGLLSKAALASHEKLFDTLTVRKEVKGKRDASLGRKATDLGEG